MPIPGLNQIQGWVRAVSDKEGKVAITDARTLTFSREATLEALLEIDRKWNGWLWRSVEHRMSLHEPAGEEKSLAIHALRGAEREAKTMFFTRSHVGAAIIHYCYLLRIPLPRSGKKVIDFTADGAVLQISQTIHAVPRHLVPGEAIPEIQAVERPPVQPRD